jgi:hypothetical protein
MTTPTRRPLLCTLMVLLCATPAVADVGVQVPLPLLGGRLPTLPAPAVPAGAAIATASGPIAPLLLAPGVAPTPSPSPRVSDAQCAGVTPLECMVWEPAAQSEAPQAVPAAAGATVQILAAATPAQAGSLRAPGFGTWLFREETVIRWPRTPGAGYYNVQVYLGRRRVINAWPVGTRLRVPEPAIDQGRYYSWMVWPGFGPRDRAAYGPPLGRSVFGVILRPRVRYRTVAAGGVAGEVRPHVPFGRLRLRAPRALRSRVPAVIQLDVRGGFRLPLSRAEARRVRPVLVDRGPSPPAGLLGIRRARGE